MSDVLAGFLSDKPLSGFEGVHRYRLEFPGGTDVEIEVRPRLYRSSSTGKVTARGRVVRTRPKSGLRGKDVAAVLAGYRAEMGRDGVYLGEGPLCEAD